MNILITGGLGYAGSVISEYLLKRKLNVTVVDKILFNNNQEKYFKKFKKFNLHKIDIIKKKNLKNLFLKKKFDIIIHLAAIVGDPASKVNKKLTFQTNINGSNNVLELAKKFNVKRFIFFSTCSNYGIMKDGEILNENSKLKPISLYAKTKVDFEKKLISDKSKIEKIILRISTLYGPSQRMRFDLTINEFVKKLYLKEKLEIYDKDTWRPYLHLEDLTKILSKIFIRKKFSNKTHIFNVGIKDENYTKKDIANILIKKIKGSSNLINFVDKKGKDLRNYKIDFRKISKLKIKSKYNLQQGIESILNNLKKNRLVNFNKKIFYNHKQ